MKQFLMNLKMSRKLLLSPLSVMIFLLVFGVVSYVGLSAQKSAINDIFNIRFQGYQTSARILNDIANVHANIYKIISWTNAKYDEKKIAAFSKEQFDTIDKAAGNMKKIMAAKALSGEERKLYQTSLDLLGEYKKPVEGVVDVAGSDLNAATMFMGTADDKFQVLNKNLQELLELENRLSKERYDSSLATFGRVSTVSVVVLFAAVVLSLFISIFMAKLILAPIRRTIEVIKDVSTGDLTKKIDIVSYDEIGEMAGHFNVFVEKLHDAITHVAKSSNEVASAATTLDHATEEMASGVEEAVVQVSSVAAASEEMSKTSSEIAQNCVMAAKSSEEANRSVNTGETVIKETITVMNRISDRVKESAEVIRSLGTRSDQIGQIVGLINDVADQTNLLALNAAIEAARAGEHGRGFAVVADEVRKLAERTSHATKEISDTIRAMQAETKKAVSSMEDGVNEVGIGTMEAAKSGEALKEILFQIGKVSGEINQIAVASEEETATTNEIATSIQQISQVMQKTAGRIQENASASSQLAGLSKGLESMVGQFKLEG
jgi:methyl-accepting chemotaxis protein